MTTPEDPKVVATRLAVAKLMSQGLKSDEIAQRLNQEKGADDEPINAYQVSHIVMKIDRGWQDAIRGEVGPWKARCLMRYDHIFREAMGSFEISKTGKKTAKKVKGKRDVVVQGGDGASTVTLNSESETGTLQDRKAGDPKYLDTAKAAVDSIAKMLGINAPLKWAETDPDGQPKREVIEKEIFDALPKAKQAAFVEIMLEMKQIELRRMQEMGYMEDEDREPVIDVEGLLPDESGGNGEAGEDYAI